MSFTDLYESEEYRNQLAHFAAIVNLAEADGKINEDEQRLIERFAHKLTITETEFSEVLKNPGNYPINPPTTAARRLERIYDLFKMVYADSSIEAQEVKLLNRYATGLGFTEEQAEHVISKSMKLFGGGIDFEDYEYFISK